jgi:hypothetical protein
MDMLMISRLELSGDITKENLEYEYERIIEDKKLALDDSYLSLSKRKMNGEKRKDYLDHCFGQVYTVAERK